MKIIKLLDPKPRATKKEKQTRKFQSPDKKRHRNVVPSDQFHQIAQTKQ